MSRSDAARRPPHGQQGPAVRCSARRRSRSKRTLGLFDHPASPSHPTCMPPRRPMFPPTSTSLTAHPGSSPRYGSRSRVWLPVRPRMVAVSLRYAQRVRLRVCAKRVPQCPIRVRFGVVLDGAARGSDSVRPRDTPSARPPAVPVSGETRRGVSPRRTSMLDRLFDTPAAAAPNEKKRKTRMCMYANPQPVAATRIKPGVKPTMETAQSR